MLIQEFRSEINSIVPFQSPISERKLYEIVQFKQRLTDFSCQQWLKINNTVLPIAEL